MAKAPVSADALAADCAALTKSVGIAAKTAGKVATDEHTFDQFVEEQALQLDEGMYPSAGTMLEFAAWLTRRRERVCLVQRVDSGPRLVGLVRTTIRNMLTELSLDRLEEGVGDPFLRIAPLRALLGSLRRGRFKFSARGSN